MKNIVKQLCDDKSLFDPLTLALSIPIIFDLLVLLFVLYKQQHLTL